MNTKKCFYLLTIEECGYLSHAANKLNITQPALGKFLAEQEHLLGLKLFVRNKKKLYPTKAGKVYLDAARQIVEVKNKTLQTMMHLNNNTQATIRIASTTYKGAELFGNVYVDFTNAFPCVSLKLEDMLSSNQEQHIHSREVDFAVGANCHADYDDVYNLQISKEELVIAVSEFHPLAQYGSKDINNIVTMPIRVFRNTPFVLQSEKSNIRLVANKMFEKAGFTPLVAFETDNNVVIKSLLSQGVGVGFQPRRYINKAEKLVYFKPDPPAYEVYYLRYLKNKNFTTAEKCLCGLMLEERKKDLGQNFIFTPQAKEFMQEANKVLCKF